MQTTDSASLERSLEETVPPLMSRMRCSPSLEGYYLKPFDDEGLVVAQRYEVAGFLGEGGTAHVYLAHDNQSGELVVVKRMKDEIAASPELRARFLLEARALACVDHPAVIRVLGIEEPDDEPPYLALEALRGETLGDYLKREGVVSTQLALKLFREATRALQAVHEVNIVHRDIKPDNLFLVGPIGAPESIKVLDFGMARLSDEAYDESSTSILGTAQYMAPEQILVEPVDARTDIYSLGVVLFRALTGVLPFEANHKHDMLRHQLFSPVPPVNWLLDGLPVGLVELVRQATRKSPSARYQSMLELVDALDRVLTSYEDKGASSSSEVRSSAAVDSPLDSPEVDMESKQAPAFDSFDIYEPISVRGKKAASVLAVQFGIYSRPHTPVPPVPRSRDASPPLQPAGEAE